MLPEMKVMGIFACYLIIGSRCVIYFQDLARGLKDLLEYEGNVEDDFGLTFQVIHCVNGYVLHGTTDLYICMCVCACMWNTM